MSTRLILLEGVPGSGKTTAGMHLQRFLAANGFPAQFWREGDFDNPADFEGVARLSETEYHTFVSRYPELESLFNEQLSIRGPDFLLWYRRLRHRNPNEVLQSLVDELSRFDVYDGLPMEDYCRLALQRWRDFQQGAMRSDAITLLECCYLQNPLTVLLARHNADPNTARKHIEEITEIIRDLDPLVIYLSPQNIRKTLEHVRVERPQEWSDFVTWYLTGQAYGKAHNLHGFEGVIQFYEMRQELELDILRGLPIRSLILEYSVADWDRIETKMDEFVRAHLAG